MAKYAGDLLPQGLVLHDLGDKDVTVALWRLNDDGSRSLVQAGVEIITADVIRVVVSQPHYMKGPFEQPSSRFRVVVTS